MSGMGLVPGEAAEGILGRRVLAWLIDALLLGLILGALHVAVGVFGLLTFGLGWLGFALLPLVPALYTMGFLLLAGAATPGMRLCGLGLVEAESGQAPGLAALVIWTLLYLASVAVFVPLLLYALIDSQHRTLHDRLAGLVMIRY